MRTSMPDVLRSAALGLASGARSTVGVAAVAWTSVPRDRGPAGLLGTPAGRAGSGLALLGETAADKHPRVPSRLDPPALLGRLTFGAGAAYATARRDRRPAGPAVLVAAAGALAGAYGGSAFRARLSDRLGSDLPGALLEDVLAALLATRGARRPPARGPLARLPLVRRS